MRKDDIRNLLNLLMIIGFVACVLLYFCMPGRHMVAFVVGGVAIVLKLAEFAIRIFWK